MRRYFLSSRDLENRFQFLPGVSCRAGSQRFSVSTRSPLRPSLSLTHVFAARVRVGQIIGHRKGKASGLE